MYPEKYRYTKDHEWIEVTGDIGTIGITHHAQEMLGDIVFIELPEVGAVLKAHESLGTVESVKAVSDIYAPVSGEVVEVHEELNDEPEQVNQDPHDAGWLVKVRLADPGELDKLMDAVAYGAFVAEEAGE
ncbi:glycine cleavage system protein GcvH [bacterium]|nr:glycine cleavage system protein GcvH [candidate division CSSED10-310 bacterium]